MKVLVVRAHPEPTSFCNAMADTAVRVLREEGHEVVESDLHAMTWSPVLSREATSSRPVDPDRFSPDREQEAAWTEGTQPADVAAEQAKVAEADLVVLHFPVWWFSMPAILKGWVDRVFARGFAYSKGRKYSRGHFVGKRAFVAITTGTASTLYEPGGVDGDLRHVLWPIHNGILAYTGFSVLEPSVGWMPGRVGPDEREGYLAAYADRLRRIAEEEPMFFHPWEDYDETERLRPGVEARSGVQWNPRAGQTREGVAADET